MYDYSEFAIGFLTGVKMLFTSLMHPMSLLSIVFIITFPLILNSRKFKGKAGEKVVDYFLSKLDRAQYRIINDITLKVRNSYAQIDHVVISAYGVFVIETKVRTGSIYGIMNAYNWTQYVGGKKISFQSPVQQNAWHIQALKQSLGNTLLFNPISIIAFSGNTTVKVSGDIQNTFVLRLSQVVPTIEAFKTPQLSQSFQDNVYSILSRLQREGKSYTKEQVQYASSRLRV